MWAMGWTFRGASSAFLSCRDGGSVSGLCFEIVSVRKCFSTASTFVCTCQPPSLQLDTTVHGLLSVSTSFFWGLSCPSPLNNGYPDMHRIKSRPIHNAGVGKRLIRHCQSMTAHVGKHVASTNRKLTSTGQPNFAEQIPRVEHSPSRDGTDGRAVQHFRRGIG